MYVIEQLADIDIPVLPIPELRNALGLVATYI